MKDTGVSTPTEPPDWEAPITLRDAAAISGLSYGYLRQRAATGELRTKRMGARLNVTTRRWLDDYLRSRPARHGAGRPVKPLPPDYQAPPSADIVHDPDSDQP